MSDKPGGHDGEDLAQAIDRLGDDFEDPLDRHTKSRGRRGWVDLILGHAWVNVLVAWGRERPYTAMHWFLYLGLGAVAIIAALLAWQFMEAPI